MKKITGLDESLNYVPTLRSRNLTNLASDGNGLFNNKIPPKEFVNKLIEIIKSERDVGLRRIVERIDGNCPESFLVPDDECKLQLKSLNTKIRKLIQFLADGNKAKVTLRFRGREMAHQELGLEMLERVESDLTDFSIVEQVPQMEGRQMVMVLAPKAIAKTKTKGKSS